MKTRPSANGDFLIRTALVIDRPYSLGQSTVGALYERPEQNANLFLRDPLVYSSAALPSLRICSTTAMNTSSSE
jgi:hypothetical protein